MADKIQLDKIKEEIKSRREQGNVVPEKLGENVNSLSSSPRDEFLNGLMTSLKTGSPTPATNLVQEVHNTVVDKKGGDTKHVTKTPIQESRPIQKSHTSKPEMSAERDEQLYKDMEKMKSQTLAESIEKFGGSGQGGNAGGNSPTVDFNGQQYLTSPPSGAGNNQGTPQQLNEGVLVESVKSIVNEHLSQNLTPIFEEAIKNTIIEMYAVEKIQEVLKENRDLIKSVVIETIREIRDKSNKK